VPVVEQTAKQALFPCPKNSWRCIKMIKINHVYYEIWDANSYEVLVTNLEFDDAAEQCKIYEEFFGAEVIVVAVDNMRVIDAAPIGKQYKDAYIDYIECLCEMGNI
jgi:hypothetical protein